MVPINATYKDYSSDVELIKIWEKESNTLNNC